MATNPEKLSDDGSNGKHNHVDDTNLERHISQDSGLSNQEHIDAFSPEEQKKIMKRVDFRLVPILGFMYCVSLMDRTNLGIAVVGGMGTDLVLQIGARYSIITLVFFLTYVFLQPPATVVLRKVGPRIFLPLITILWGITAMCFGFVKTWEQMIPLRLVLGIFEAGFFPGCAYLLSCWYPRYELQKRNAVFYLIGSMASAFSGILAYGFFNMQGLGGLGEDYSFRLYDPETFEYLGFVPGLAGWRWIFIMQGLITILVGMLGCVFIADFPEKAANKTTSLALPFLNVKEAEFVVARIEQDRHDAIAEPFSIGAYLRCGLDAKIWGFASLFMLTTTVTYAIAYFLPIILQDGMGFGIAEAQCLIAPPYVMAAIWMFGSAVIGDKYHIRGPLIIGNACLGLIGLPLIGYAENVGARYFGVFLATTACNANVPAVLTYQANNIRGQWKRAFCSATLVGAGGIGGIIGSTVFRSDDAPEYIPGIITTIIASALVIVITAAMDFGFHQKNKKAERTGEALEGLEGFRYTL